ncbi:DUF1566 domain-containing protein [Hydrogenophaga sp. RWCD_12]|uniref:Lcl C-terminal domain-containing protein n=1 Tax=Hydrogenophaga sp. RWCD_12 TaxID=3391190 RepID=UPI003984F68F
MSKHGLLLATTLSLMGVSAAKAACPSVPTVSRYSFNAAGDEVTDSKTRLVWARCSLGQTWDGTTCTGTASTHSHEQAMGLAQAASGWRLPNVKELTSIADKGCRSPAIDSKAFPNTPRAWYWSSSPYVGGAGNAWIVDFDDGSVNYGDRSYLGYPRPLRLVRVSQ